MEVWITDLGPSHASLLCAVHEWADWQATHSLSISLTTSTQHSSRHEAEHTVSARFLIAWTGLTSVSLVPMTIVCYTVCSFAMCNNSTRVHSHWCKMALPGIISLYGRDSQRWCRHSTITACVTFTVQSADVEHVGCGQLLGSCRKQSVV